MICSAKAHCYSKRKLIITGLLHNLGEMNWLILETLQEKWCILILCADQKDHPDGLWDDVIKEMEIFLSVACVPRLWARWSDTSSWTISGQRDSVNSHRCSAGSQKKSKKFLHHDWIYKFCLICLNSAVLFPISLI